MYTPEGTRQRNALLKVTTFNLADYLLPVINKIPAVVIERTKSSGGAKGSYSPYKTHWTKVRERKGLQTGNKDFWFEGDMWKTYKVTTAENTDYGAMFILSSEGAVGHNGKELVDIHSDKEGQNLLDITDDEWKDIEDELMIEIEKKIDAILGS